MQDVGTAVAAAISPPRQAVAQVRVNRDIERRRAKALAMLADNPTWRRFIVVEAGEPTIIGVAIRGLGYGELEVPAERYDAQALLEVLNRYGDEAPTVH